MNPTLASISLLLTLIPIASTTPTYVPITRTCATADPSTNLTSTHRWLQLEEPHENDLYNSSIIQSRLALPIHARAPILTIPTYFHIIATDSTSSPDQPNYVGEDQLYMQLDYLNTQYAPFGIVFDLLSITRTTNTAWASNQNDLAMKRALRRGTYSALNVYFQSSLQETSSGLTLLGFCTLPSAGITTATPPDSYVDDGCNILSSTIPGGSYSGYNLGGTTVHEVGHFLGLLHTFMDETCSPTSFGDYVADTPQQRVATMGCPSAAQDSCPESGAPAGWTGAAGQGANPYGPQGYSGLDPKENFMDYSNDVCYRGFTAGQGARAINLFELYREGK